MPHPFTATLLLDRPWPLDLDLAAQTLACRFRGIGDIGTIQGQAPTEAGHLSIDHAEIAIRSVPQPVPADRAFPDLKIGRSWDPGPAFSRHTARISVTCGGDLPGLEGAQAYAAAVHFVATTLAGLAPTAAVLWGPAFQLIEPETFENAAEQLLGGTLPATSWISYAPVVPHDSGETTVTGMVTYGLGPFIGHEIELAPRPGDAPAAYHCLSAILSQLLRGRIDLHDGLRLVDRATDLALTAHRRRHWLRRNGPVYVLVANDAAVDPATLRFQDVA